MYLQYIDTLWLERTEFAWFIFSRGVLKARKLITFKPSTESCLEMFMQIHGGGAFRPLGAPSSALKEIDCTVWVMLCWRAGSGGHPHPSPEGFFASCVQAALWIWYRLLLLGLSLTLLISSPEDRWVQRDHNILSVFITRIIWQLLAMGGWVEDGCVRLPVSGVRCVYLTSKSSVVDWVTLHPSGAGVDYCLMWQPMLGSCHLPHLSEELLVQKMKTIHRQ